MKTIFELSNEFLSLEDMNLLEYITDYSYDKLINDHYNVDRTFKELEAITNA